MQIYQLSSKYILVGCGRITNNSSLFVEVILFKLMPGQWGYRNTAKGTFFGINQLVVVAVDPKDADKDGDSPGDVDDGEEDPGELRSKVFFLLHDCELSYQFQLVSPERTVVQSQKLKKIVK